MNRLTDRLRRVRQLEAYLDEAEKKPRRRRGATWASWSQEVLRSVLEAGEKMDEDNRSAKPFGQSSGKPNRAEQEARREERLNTKAQRTASLKYSPNSKRFRAARES